MDARRAFAWVLIIAVAFPLVGCNGCSGGSDENVNFVLGNMLEKFDPPTMQELNAVVEKAGGWQERNLVDFVDVLRDQQKADPPKVTVKEALEMRNNTVDDNTAILSALSKLPANQEADVNYDGEVVRHAPGDVNSTNPLFGSSTVEFEVQSLMAIGLVSIDKNLKYYGAKDTVASWQSSKDRLFDKFVLRDDLTWSDGKPVTAHDFEFTFQLIMSKEVPVTARSVENQLKWVKAYDDRTLVIFHKQSLPINDTNCGISVLPKHIYEKSCYEDPTLKVSDYHIKYEDNPVVAGAYELTKRDRRQEIILSRRDKFWKVNDKKVRDQPFIKTVRFRVIPDSNSALLALKRGEIQDMILSPNFWTTQTNDADYYKHNTKAFGREWTGFHITWNTKSKFFNDKRVRQAMSYALDYDELLQKHRFGLDDPSNGPLNPNSQWYPKDGRPPYKQDLSAARKLLQEAGWTDSDGDGVLDKTIDGKKVKFEFTLKTSSRPERVAMCNLFAQNFRNVGILCDVKSLEGALFQNDMMEKRFDAGFGGWGTGSDPFSLENIFSSTGERNFGSYSNPEVDQLFKDGMKELDQEKRIAIYGKIHNLLFDDQVYTWLYYQNSYYGFNKSIRGYNFSPRGPFGYSPGFGSIWKPSMN